MLIRVTQEHIDKGLRSHTDACPIALAIKDATGIRCRVRTNCLLFVKSFEFLTVAMPDKARVFVSKFDTGMPVEPFSFEISGDSYVFCRD